VIIGDKDSCCWSLFSHSRPPVVILQQGPLMQLSTTPKLLTAVDISNISSNILLEELSIL